MILSSLYDRMEIFWVFVPHARFEHFGTFRPRFSVLRGRLVCAINSLTSFLFQCRYYWISVIIMICFFFVFFFVMRLSVKY